MKFYKKLVACMLSVSLLLTGIYVEKVTEVKAESSDHIRYSHFLKANGTVLKDNYGQGNPVLLKGVNAGGYMLQELWMCPTKEIATIKDQTDIINTLVKEHGKTKMRQLIATYEKAYWTEKDFENCKNLGMNCIRLPIWYRNLVDEDGNWYADAFERIDWFVEKAGEYGMYVIIDMHGAFGSQNGSDTSGVEGNRSYDKDSKEAMIAKKEATKFFFDAEAKKNQEKYYQMWEKIAQHYKGNPVVAGYDLLNEPFGAYRNSIDSITELGLTEDQIHTTLWDVYDKAYKRIRAIDSDHVIIMEAVWEASDLPDPSRSEYHWENIMYEYHHYDYAHATDTPENAAAQITSMTNKLNSIFEKNYNVPSYMGEFNFMATTTAWSEGLDLLNSYNISWTSWGYKCTKGMGNWGLYNNTIDDSNIADISTERFESVSNKWSNVGTENYTKNTLLIDVFKTKMNSSPITGLTDAVSSSIPKISEAKVTSDIGEIELTYKTPEGMPSDAKYYIYLDDETKPSNIISSRIEAEKYSESSGNIHKNIQDKDQNGIPNDNVGGTNDGEWTRYDNIDFGTGNATEVTVRYSKKWVSNDHKPKLEVYIDDVTKSSNKVGTINLVQSQAEEDWFYFKLGTAMLDTKITGQHNVFIKYVANDRNNVCNLDWIEFSSQQVQSGTIKYSDLDSGNHKITIKTYVNGNFSDATVIDNIQLSEILINESIGVEGFQIKTNNTSDKVAFRAVCKAPNIGSKFTLGGREYTVKDVGTIYTLDTDTSGIHGNAKVGDEYTELSSTTVDNAEHKYVGRKKYKEEQKEEQRTYGYLATEKGVYKDWNAEDTQNSYYVRTMYDGEGYTVVEHTIHVRAFIVATYNNKEYIVYGKNVAHMSIAEVANYIYENSLSSNFTGHKYLYESILSRLNQKNPYYKNSTVAYGWNDNLYTPNTPSIINGPLNKYVKKDRITATAEEARPDEGPKNLFDGKTSTKYCTKGDDQKFPFRIQWEMQRPATITSYTLTTGNDTAGNPYRNPKAWTLSGSMDGTTWTELDSVESGGMEAKNLQPYTYTTKTKGAYQYFKLEIRSSEGSALNGQIQLSELSLQGYVSK